MAARNILELPAQFQWDTDSAPCQNSNCRCTCEAMIAGFYSDSHVSPNNMRHAMGYVTCGGTDAPHGVYGLKAYGVPATWGQLTTYELITKLNQNIPVDIAVLYSTIPRNSKYIQDMNFYGLHSVVACKRVSVNGVLGLYIRDPDRWGTSKVPYVFWPDSIWIPAFAAAKYVAVWPVNPKVVTTLYPYSAYRSSVKYQVNTNGLYQRSAPNTSATQETLRPNGFVFTSYLRTDKGGVYVGPNGANSTSWVGWISTDGKYHWLALAFLKVI